MPDYRDNPLDQEVNTEFMRVCKCVIPYLDTSIQKNVAIGLKFLELMNTINAFSETSTFSTNLSLTRQGPWEQDLLRSVRSNLSTEKAYIIDAIIKLQEFRSILNAKDPEQPPNYQGPQNPPNNFSDPPSENDQNMNFEPFNPSDAPPAFEPFEPADSSQSFGSFNPSDSAPGFGPFNPSEPPPAFEPFNPSDSTSYSNSNNSGNTANNFTPHNTPPRPSNNGPSPANVIQMLSPLLDDNQKQMLSLFTSFLGNK